MNPILHTNRRSRFTTLSRSGRVVVLALLSATFTQTLPFTAHGKPTNPSPGQNFGLINVDIGLPIITSPGAAGGTVGQLLSYQISSSLLPTSYGASNLPPGLSINTATGLIAGTPTQDGLFTASVTATNLLGTGTQNVSFTILPGNGVTPPATVPVITSPIAAAGQIGQSFNYQVNASGAPTNYAAVGLPTGLAIDPTSGLISGDPTQSGLFTVQLSAGNLLGTGMAPLTLTVLPSDSGALAPVVISPVTAAGEVGQALSYQIGATGSPTGYSAAGLPDGLSVDASTGLISGTPTQAGVFTASVSATSALGTGTAPLTLTILPGIASPLPVISTVTPPPAQVGIAYSFQISATGNPTLYAAATLPAGLTLDATSGLISGVPTASGSFTTLLQATGLGGTGLLSDTIMVAPMIPIINSPLSLELTVGEAGNYQVTALGYPTSFSATGLPAGLSINASTGLISGTPTTAGVSTVTVTATGPNGSASAPITVGVTADDDDDLVAMINSPAGTLAQVGQPYSYQISSNIGTGGFYVTGLPTGLSVDVNTGLITGVPTQAGDFNVGVNLPGVIGMNGGIMKLIVQPAAPSGAPVITSSTSENAQQNSPFDYQITATNSPTSYGADGLPAGLVLNELTGEITGTPTDAGNFSFVISAANANGSGETTLSLVVAPDLPQITITADKPTVTAGTGDFGQFQLTRSGSNAQIIRVTYTVHGSAERGVDYQNLRGAKKFRAGKSLVHINIYPQRDEFDGAPKRTVRLVLDQGASTYDVSGNPSAKVKIYAAPQ